MFLTVHDLRLTAEEAQVWGALPRTPEAYHCVDGISPHDSALAHMVLVCIARKDLSNSSK